MMTDPQIEAARAAEEIVLDPFGPNQIQPASTHTEGVTLGQVIKTLSALAQDVREPRGSVGRLSWSIPLIVGVGMAVVGIIVPPK